MKALKEKRTVALPHVETVV